MEKGALAIVGIGQLVTLAGPRRPRVREEMRDLAIVEHAAIVAKQGRIEVLGKREDVEPRIPPEAMVVDAGGRLVTPGLVDAHTHLVFVGARADEFALRTSGASYEQIAAAGGGIYSTANKTRAASQESLVEAGARHAGWALRCGTTTAEAKSGYGLSVEHELKMLRALRSLRERTPLDLVPTLLAAHAVPKGSSTDAWVAAACDELLPAAREEELAEFCDVFCERGYFDAEASHAILKAAKDLGFGLRVHADQLTRCGGAMLAARLRAKTADHLEQAEATDFDALASAGVQPVLLPASVYALGKSKYPDARRMIEAGCAVVLATDFNPGSSPTPSLPMVMSLACTQMGMTAEEALTACTVNAAYSLDRPDRGSLVPGQRADFVVWEAADYREIPYWFGFETASEVFVCGERVVSRTVGSTA